MWTKICGITNAIDADVVANAGVDAVGLNFYEPSSRYVTPDAAAELRALMGDAIDVVGVFVNSPIDAVAAIAESVGLTTVQFHGDETVAEIAEFHAQCPHLEIIRAFRVGPQGFADVERQLSAIKQKSVPLKAILVDAYKPGEYGGTGKQINPQLVGDWVHRATYDMNVILAGGLTPQNVADAIKVARPWGVDTASGVETEPGQKSSDLVQRFIAEARRSEGDFPTS